MDDEYFRLTLSIRHNAKRPLAEPVADTALRGLGRDQHARLRKSFLRGVREVDIKTPSGIYAGRGGAYDVDLARLGKVVIRIMRGLYFHHYGEPLPAWCAVDSWCVDGFEGADSSVLQTLQNWIIQLQRHPPIEIGGGVFKYWHCLADDDAKSDNFSSVWFLLFYESTAFFGVTIGRAPNNMLSPTNSPSGEFGK